MPWGQHSSHALDNAKAPQVQDLRGFQLVWWGTDGMRWSGAGQALLRPFVIVSRECRSFPTAEVSRSYELVTESFSIAIPATSMTGSAGSGQTADTFCLEHLPDL